jgi:hypothetical protein
MKQGLTNDMKKILMDEIRLEGLGKNVIRRKKVQNFKRVRITAHAIRKFDSWLLTQIQERNR